MKDGELRKDLPNNEILSKYAEDSSSFLKSLSPLEHNVVSYWTGAGAAVTGSYIYKTDNPWKIKFDEKTKKKDPENYFDAKSYIGELDKALDKAELDEPIILYRGLGNVIPESVKKENSKEGHKPETEKWLLSFKEGEEVTFDLPRSTSSSVTTALNFGHGFKTVMEIKATKAAAVGVTSAWGFGEMEYLIPRTTKYKVVGVQENVPYESRFRPGKTTYRNVIQLEQIVE